MGNEFPEIVANRTQILCGSKTLSEMTSVPAEAVAEQQ